jgi:hypothetical protein
MFLQPHDPVTHRATSGGLFPASPALDSFLLFSTHFSFCPPVRNLRSSLTSQTGVRSMALVRCDLCVFVCIRVDLCLIWPWPPQPFCTVRVLGDCEVTFLEW